MIAAASRASCARPYGTPWTRLLRPLATATPCTACPPLPKHTLRATMKIPAPPSPPTLNSTRNVRCCPRKHEALTGHSFSVRGCSRTQHDPQHRDYLRSPIFHDASRWLCGQAAQLVTGRGRVACGHAQPTSGSVYGRQQDRSYLHPVVGIAEDVKLAGAPPLRKLPCRFQRGC